MVVTNDEWLCRFLEETASVREGCPEFYYGICVLTLFGLWV